MKTRTLKMNSIINGIRSLSSVLFPIISFKYVSAILQIENIGRYNFSASVVAYFSYVAALGITAYSVRSGAALRDTKDKIEQFASEIFTINVYSTLFAYGLLFASIIFFRELDECRGIILILSIQIFFRTMGVEWLYSIYEDYFFVTIRSIILQAVSLLLLFIMVREVNDVNQYALITVISSAGTGIIDFVYSKKYCKLKILRHCNLKKHIIPILIIFAQNISVLIYVNSDITLLGLLTDDYCTGLYSVATNIYKGIKTLLSALIMVAIPRLSFYLGKGDRLSYDKTLNKIFSTMMTFVFPVIVGIISLSDELIIFLANESFYEAGASVKLLSVATLFCMLAYIFGQCILIPMHKEKILLIATLLSAVINILLNFVLIPILKQDGAAITTIFSEALVFMISWYFVRNEIHIENWFGNIIKPIIGSIFIYLSCASVKMIFRNIYVILTASITVSIVVYGIVELILKNAAAIEVVHKVSGWKNEKRKDKKNN